MEYYIPERIKTVGNTEKKVGIVDRKIENNSFPNYQVKTSIFNENDKISLQQFSIGSNIHHTAPPLIMRSPIVNLSIMSGLGFIIYLKPFLNSLVEKITGERINKNTGGKRQIRRTTSEQKIGQFTADVLLEDGGKKTKRISVELLGLVEYNLIFIKVMIQ